MKSYYYCPVCDTLLNDKLICPKCTQDNSDVPILRQRLVVEAVGCSGLDDLSLAYRFMEALASTIEVTLYSPPIVVRTPGQGITAVAILLESGAILHTWPEYGFTDVYIESCKEFDTTVIEPLFKTFFGANLVKIIIDNTINGE